MGSRFPTPGGADDNAEARIRDMDEEGVDVQLRTLLERLRLRTTLRLRLDLFARITALLNDFCSNIHIGSNLSLW